MSDLIYSAIGRALARFDLARRRFAAQQLAVLPPEDNAEFIAGLSRRAAEINYLNDLWELS
jgi:hypothetical protein